MAALAVARMIAKRGDKHAVGPRNRVVGFRWSLDCNSFGFSVSLGLSGLVYFAACVSFRPFGVTIAVAISIRLFRFRYVPQKVPNGSQHLWTLAYARLKTESSNKFFQLT